MFLLEAGLSKPVFLSVVLQGKLHVRALNEKSKTGGVEDDEAFVIPATLAAGKRVAASARGWGLLRGDRSEDILPLFVEPRCARGSGATGGHVPRATWCRVVSRRRVTPVLDTFGHSRTLNLGVQDFEQDWSDYIGDTSLGISVSSVPTLVELDV